MDRVETARSRRRTEAADIRRLPNLVLAGISRAGTTSLFWYLSQHPDVCASRIKEPLFFLALSEADADADGVLPPLDRYAALFDRCRSERYAMEASTHYFHGGPRLIEGLRRTLPDPRIVLTLRDPVDRVWSIYTHARGIGKLPAGMSFDGYVEECERQHRIGAPRRKRAREYWSIRGGMYADYLPDWLEGFPSDRLRIEFLESFAPDPAGTIRGLCSWLGIDTSCVDAFDLSVENRSVTYRSRLLHRFALTLNRRLLRDRRRLKAPLRRVYQAINASRRPEIMPSEAREHLVELFAPSNARIRQLLLGRGHTGLPRWLAEAAPSRNAA
jgi:sulfotransferase family protein